MLALALAASLFVAEPTETGLSIPGGKAPLHGTLLTPAKPVEAVAVILPGSGPTDRNGNSPAGIAAATYRLLAEGLAAQGVATVRIDKRGIGQSAAAGGPEQDLRFSHMVEDARAWATATAERTGQSCVWLIGHSEGALVALAAVEGANDKVCGLVLLSGAGRRARIVLEEQLGAQLPEPMRTQAFHALAELEAGRTVADTPPALAALLRPSVQPYLISWLALDPAALTAAYEGPVMVGSGTTDIQTPVIDARTLAGAREGVRLVLWEGVNHVLKVAPADRAGNIATYSDPALPLAPSVVDDVARFILEAR